MSLLHIYTSLTCINNHNQDFNAKAIVSVQIQLCCAAQSQKCDPIIQVFDLHYYCVLLLYSCVKNNNVRSPVVESRLTRTQIIYLSTPTTFQRKISCFFTSLHIFDSYRHQLLYTLRAYIRNTSDHLTKCVYEISKMISTSTSNINNMLLTC